MRQQPKQNTAISQAKIAAQRREKRIKTTTGNTPPTARLVGSAAQNRKRNPPDQRTEATAVRSTSATTKQTKTSANKNIVRQTNTHQRRLSRGSVRPGGRIHPRTAEITSQTKNTPVGRAKPIQPTKPSENCRTNHTNKQTRRKTLRQHSTRRHKSALCYKIQTHASHRAKKQKTGFNPNFTRKLTEGAQKNTEKYCVSRETLNIISINFSQTHRVSYCEKQELQKKQ